MRRLLIALPLLAAPAAEAQEVACGEPYMLRRGDTLQRIANSVYGPDASFAPIWEANRARLRWGDPSHIEIGQTIEIPCLPLSDAGSAADAGPVDGAPADPAELDASASAPPATQGDAAAAPDAAEAAPNDADPPPAVAIAPGSNPDAEAPAADADVALATPPSAPAEQPADETPSAMVEEVSGPGAAGEGDFAAEAPPGQTRAETSSDARPVTEPDAAGAAATATTVMSAASATEAVPPPETPHLVRLLAIEDPPLVDRTRPSEGLATAVVRAAFATTGLDTALTHERPSAEATISYDISFPWVRPECDAADLPAPDRAACDALLWSEPVGEHVTAFVARAGLVAPDSLAGLAVCAASGTPGPALRGAGSVTEEIGADQCLEALTRGEADLAALEAGAADAALGTGVYPELAEVWSLAHATPVHAVAPMGAPDAAVHIAALNEGLRLLRREGRWLALVEAALRN